MSIMGDEMDRFIVPNTEYLELTSLSELDKKCAPAHTRITEGTFRGGKHKHSIVSKGDGHFCHKWDLFGPEFDNDTYNDLKIKRKKDILKNNYNFYKPANVIRLRGLPCDFLST